MKLRNKKTGKIIEYSIGLNEWSENEQEWYLYGNYDTIEELKEEWEDYDPTEPLIKEEKARKVFQEWAGFFGAERFRVEHLCKYGRTIITSTDLTAEPVIELPGYIGEDSEIYTKIELVGEEQE